MINADEDEWLALGIPRLGKKTAKDIVAAVKNR
jgi:hypothetical protein